MKWPWVSRLAYENMVSERDHLRMQLSQMALDRASVVAQLTRISRREAGLPETPKEARKPMEPMPPALAEYIRGFAGQSLQKSMRDQAYIRCAKGESWDSIMADVMREEEET